MKERTEGVLYPYLRRPLPNNRRASGGNDWVSDWVTDQKSSFNFAENWLRWSSGQINFKFFGTLEVFFAKSEKNPISSWKIREFLDFFFKFTLLQRPFFSKKKVLWSCSKLAQMRFRVNKFEIFWNIRDFFWKSLKKSDFKFEIWENFYIGFPCKIKITWEFFVKWTQIFFRKKVSLILLKIGSAVVHDK